MWSGAIADIPDGWKLCDGNNNTPDLREKFILGAGGTKAVDETGGATEHTHEFTSDYHHHDIIAGTDIAAGAEKDLMVAPTLVHGTTDNAANMPPYHALHFIMKK